MVWSLLVALVPPAHAQDRGARADDAAFAAEYGEPIVPTPRDRLYYTNASFARVNPLGLVDLVKVGWRRRLSDKDSLLLSDTYTFVAASAMITPAYSRLGVFAEAQALAILRVFGEVDAVGYYGTFDQVLSWDDPRARYSDRTIAALGDAGAHRATLGWVVTGGATLRAKVGPVAVRSTAQLTRYDLDLPDGDVVFYDQYWDRLAPDRGWMALNDLDLLFVRDKLRLGARYTATAQVGDRTDGADGSRDTHRVGPLFAWQLSDRPPGTRVNQPTVFVIAQWWLAHPYRAGAEQPVALPLVAAGLAFNGDLWTSAP